MPTGTVHLPTTRQLRSSSGASGDAYAGFQLSQVGAVGTLLLGRADADEMDIAEGGGLGVTGGEAEAAFGQAGSEQGLEAGFVEGDDTTRERGDPVRVCVHPQHVEPRAGQARCLGRAQVAGAENSKPVRHY